MTRPSTPKLSEAARHVVYPSTIERTLWPRVVAKGKDLGIGFDPWQDGAGQLALGLDGSGRFAATVGGVVMSIARQVGKTYFVGMTIVILCILFPNLQVVWTTHHLRTTTKTFQTLSGLVKRPLIRKHLKQSRNEGIRSANGEQEIEFRNGSKIMFGARAQGFGRGFDEIDIMVFDEAQILDEKALEDMVAATNQARFEFGALLFYTGTPPRPNDPSEAFTAKRKKALSGEATNLVYIECSADPDAKLDDPEQMLKANPSYPTRTPHESMLRLRENLPSDDSWRREGLGIWDEFDRALVMPHWFDRGMDVEELPAPEAIGVAVSIDRAWSSIAVCGWDDEGDPLLGANQRRRGVDWVVAEVVRIHREHKVPVVIAGRGPGASLIKPLEDEGVDLIIAGIEDYQDACADLYDRIEAHTPTAPVVRHANHAELSDAAAAAGWTAGERPVWTRKSGDVSMLEAATLALWEATHADIFNIY